MILSISFRALVEPPLDGVFEHSSGSKFSLVLPAFLFPLSLFSVLEQSVLATLLRVSQSHFEAPSGPFLEGSNAGPTHLRSKGYNYVLYSLSVWKEHFSASVSKFYQIPSSAILDSWVFLSNLRSQAVALTATIVGFPVEKVSVP